MYSEGPRSSGWPVPSLSVIICTGVGNPSGLDCGAEHTEKEGTCPARPRTPATTSRRRRGRELAGGHRGIRRLRRGIRARGGVLAECLGGRAERRGCWWLLDGFVRGAVGRRRDVVAGVLGRAGHVPSFSVCSAPQPSPDGFPTPVQMITERPWTGHPTGSDAQHSAAAAAARVPVTT